MNAGESRLGEAAAALRRDFDRSFAEAPTTRTAAFDDFLAIRIGGDPYAVRVSEIVGLHADRRVVPIPSPLPELLGIAGFRGLIAPVYDLGVLLGYAGARSPRWLVLVRLGDLVGFAFDVFEAHLRMERNGGAPKSVLEGERRHVQGVVRIAGVARPVVDIPSVGEAIRNRVRADGPLEERDS